MKRVIPFRSFTRDCLPFICYYCGLWRWCARVLTCQHRLRAEKKERKQCDTNAPQRIPHFHEYQWWTHLNKFLLIVTVYRHTCTWRIDETSSDDQWGEINRYWLSSISLLIKYYSCLALIRCFKYSTVSFYWWLRCGVVLWCADCVTDGKRKNECLKISILIYILMTKMYNLFSRVHSNPQHQRTVE